MTAPSLPRCLWCERPLRASARFCAECGMPAAPPALSLPPGLEPAADALAALAAGWGRAPETAALAERLRGAVEEGRPFQGWIVGEGRRGKKTLLQLLQGAGEAEGWRPLLLPATTTTARQRAALDLAAADGVLLCLSATQLLSASERGWIEDLVLPTGAPTAVVIHRLDLVDTASDGPDLDRRLQRYLDRLGVGWAILGLGKSPDGAFSSPPLIDAARGFRARATQSPSRRSQRKLAALLPLLQQEFSDPAQSLATAAEGTSQNLWHPPSPSSLIAALAAATSAGRARLQARVTELRIVLPARLQELPVEILEREGARVLAREGEALRAEVAEAYLESLERAGAVAPEQRAAVSPLVLKGLVPPAPGERPAEAAPGDAPTEDTRRPADWRAALAAAAGIGLVATAGAALWPLLGGAALLAGSWKLRQQQSESHADQLRRTVHSAALQWLAGVESDLDERLARLGEEVCTHLRTPPEGRSPSAPLASPASRWLAILQTWRQSHPSTPP